MNKKRLFKSLRSYIGLMFLAIYILYSGCMIMKILSGIYILALTIDFFFEIKKGE